jgi:hypothetical protein
MTDQMGYTINPARYAKGMMAVRCPSADAYKTRAAYLAEYFARDRYSGRENAYIMSQAAAKKFEAHYAAGWDAGIMVRRLIPPRAA